MKKGLRVSLGFARLLGLLVGIVLLDSAGQGGNAFGQTPATSYSYSSFVSPSKSGYKSQSESVQVGYYNATSTDSLHPTWSLPRGGSLPLARPLRPGGWLPIAPPLPLAKPVRYNS